MNSPLANASLAPQPPAAPNVPVANELPPPLPELVEGLVPAVLVPPITEEVLQEVPQVEMLVQNFDQIYQLGLETYEAQDLSTVVYNPDLVSEQQLQEAEGNGTLAQLAVPLIPGAGEEMSMAAPPAPAGGPLAGADVSPAARAANMQPPQISPIQPNPIGSQLARRAI